MQGFDVYKTYLAFKQHFANPKFDFFQYDGKVRAKESTYHDRKDFYFFETLARKHTDQEIKEFLLASFISADDPAKVWIGDIKRNGKANWLVWTKLHESLAYAFKQDLNRVAEHMETTSRTFNDLFKTMGTHPPLLRLYIKRSITLETLTILDMVLGFMVQWDRELRDPLWTALSMKIKKYKPFLSLNTTRYKSIIQETFL
jgi:hypothetical protein